MPYTYGEMELAWQNDLSVEKWVLKIGKVLFCLAIIISFILWSILIFGHSLRAKLELNSPIPVIATLGQGPLALNRPQSKELQPLLQELVLIGANTRPDQDRVCSLALRSSGEKKTLSLGETFFFEMKEGRLLFSKETTDLRMTARSLENGLLICEIKNKNSSESCTLTPSAIFSPVIEQEPYVETLKKGAVWGKDVFLTGWGGDEYREMTNKAKISFGPDVYFLKPGDCLWWNGKTWVSDIESDTIEPIAQLVKVSSHGADFQVWDSTGLSSQTIHIGTQASSKSPLTL
ncbi:MAG: hypothetical protein ACRDF4_05290, partial [Rhabdochlamydiaceae bacterium]